MKTEPFNITVKRTRADFKWLGEKLVTEFPNKQLPNIDKGDLSKKVIEDYFHALIQKEGIGISRYLNYFLTTDDRMFEERKNSEENFIGNLMGKLKRPGVSLEELGISDKQKTKVVPVKQTLSLKEESDIQLFLDELQEAIRVFGDVYKQ